MTSIASIIIPGTKIVRAYAERLVKDIPSEKFARTPEVGGITIVLNHPAFNFGHLSLYPGRLVPFLAIEASGLTVPATYEDLFKDGTPCVDDVACDHYPSKDEILATFFSRYETLLTRLVDVPDSVFLASMEDPKRKERFPTNGAFAAYLLSAHLNGHLGQVSAWRRCMGMPPA